MGSADAKMKQNTVQSVALNGASLIVPPEFPIATP